LINVQPEENCRIDEWLELNGWNSDLIGRNSDLLDGIPIYWTEFQWIGWNLVNVLMPEFIELLCCSGVEVLVGKAVENVQVLVSEKKSAWTDLDRVSFQKNLQSQNAEIEKSAWTGLGKVKKKASSAASVFKISSGLVIRGSPKHFALQWPDLIR
jgi:hypothetical protein